MASSYNELAKIKDALRISVAKLMALKEAGEGLGSMRQLMTESAVMLIEMRQLNRIILRNEEEVKLHTEAAKAPVDSTTLRLNNLLYEKNHFVKAIKSCNEFKSKYPNIELVSENEFFDEAPAEFKVDPELKTDRHKLMLQRLKYELYQRKELAKRKEELDARKRTLQENVTSRKKFLATLPEHLKALKVACLPVQQQLGLQQVKKLQRQKLAELLPAPLFILYSQLVFYHEVFGESMEVEVTGSEKEAEALLRFEAIREAGFTDGTATDEAKQEAVEDEDGRARRKRTKHTHDATPLIDLEGLAVHPLSVTLRIFDEGIQSAEQNAEAQASPQRAQLACLHFEYLRKLRLVCASAKGTGSSGPSLDELFPNDSGSEVPDPALKLLQSEAAARSLGERPGKPYKWAQHLAGLDFLPEVPPHMQSQAAALVSGGLAKYRQEHRVQNVLQRLRSHFQSVKGQP